MLDVRDPVGPGEEEDRGKDDGEEGDGIKNVRHGGRTVGIKRNGVRAYGM